MRSNGFVRADALRLGAAVLAALFMAPSGVLCAQDIVKSTAMTRPLSLDQFVRLATERDTEFEEILIDRLYLRYEKTLRLPAPDLVLSVRSQYDFFLDENREDAEHAVSLSKLFPVTGTRVSAGYGVTPFASGAPDASEAFVSLSQSIAENAFGRSTRLLNRIVGLEVDVARHQIIEAYEDYLATLVSAYYEWYEAYENLKIGEAAYKTNLQLLENMRARQRNRIALPVDVNKVRLQVVARRENLIRLTERYKSRLNVIERAIREDLGATAMPEAPPIPETPENYLEAWHETFRNDSRTYKILDLLTARSKLNVDREANALLPSVEALFGFETEGETSALRRRGESAFAGIALEWPIPDVQARAQKRVAEIERKETELSNENLRYSLFTRLKNLALQIEREKELIQTAEEKIQLADAILKAESENYSFGRASLNDYIQAVSDLDNTRFEKITHEVLLRQLLLEFRRLTDVLVSANDAEAVSR